MATDPLVSVFGGWQAIENASLALSESANLLLVPGRVCSNGVSAPINDPTWSKFVRELRDAGLKAYAAAKEKDQDKMTDVSEVVNDACVHCHRKWRPMDDAKRCK
jgi:cytochrome c556